MFSVAPGICHRVEYYQIGRPETRSSGYLILTARVGPER
jgi:hypothetical protein